MGSSTKKTISFSVTTPEHKAYLNRIAEEKGYGNASVMARVALEQMLNRKKISFEPPEAFTVRD